MEQSLVELLKKYVNIFITEYEDYLSNNQLEIIRNIDYSHIISFCDTEKPFGDISLGRINLSNVNKELITNLSNMPEYNKTKYPLNNKNLSSYLKYMCDNGYSLMEYMSDILMYFVFFLVIRNHSAFINGLINQEIHFLSIKYSFHSAYLFAKEDYIISKINPIFKRETLRRIMFMDKVSTFKYLNENYGFRYSIFFDEISCMLDEKYHELEEKCYQGFEGFLNYTEDYDNIIYSDAYNCLLDFKAQNGINY